MLEYSIEWINKFAFTLLLLNDSQSVPIFYSETIHLISCEFTFSKTKVDNSYKNKYKDKVLVSIIYFLLLITFGFF